MERTFALSELAQAVSLHEDQRPLLVRRIRHWTLAGALPTAGVAHAGTGRHRRYATNAAYLVAILDRLADWGLPIGILKAATERVLDFIARNDPAWRDAVAGRRPVFMFFLPWHPSDEPDHAVGGVLELLSQDEMAERLKRASEGTFLNLTQIFRHVAL